MQTQMTDAELTVFEGLYIHHWEVPCLRVRRSRRFLGLIPVYDSLYVRFPKGFHLPELTLRDARKFHMKVTGRLGPRGQYGHMGHCSHQLDVQQVVECREVTD